MTLFKTLLLVFIIIGGYELLKFNIRKVRKPKNAEPKCKSYFGDYKCHVATSLKDSEGRTIYVDKCLKEAVENLNAQGFKTVASCCGHGIIQPSIEIELTN